MWTIWRIRAQSAGRLRPRTSAYRCAPGRVRGTPVGQARSSGPGHRCPGTLMACTRGMSAYGARVRGHHVPAVRPVRCRAGQVDRVAETPLHTVTQQRAHGGRAREVQLDDLGRGQGPGVLQPAPCANRRRQPGRVRERTRAASACWPVFLSAPVTMPHASPVSRSTAWGSMLRDGERRGVRRRPLRESCLDSHSHEGLRQTATAETLPPGSVAAYASMSSRSEVRTLPPP